MISRKAVDSLKNINILKSLSLIFCSELTIIILLFLVSLVVRYLSISPLESIGTGDSANYVEAAQRLLTEHKYINNPGLRSFWPPMFPFIMAGIFKLFGWNFYNVQIFNILISAFSCVLVYFITSKLFGRFAGIVAGTIFAFYHLFIFYCNYLQTEILYIFFMSLFLYLAIKLLKNPSMKTNIISALCFVFAYYTRIEILSLLPFILFWIMLDNKVFNKQKLKYICMFCLVFFLALAPWIIRNYIIHHTFVMGTTNMGISLYIGNNQ